MISQKSEQYTFEEFLEKREALNDLNNPFLQKVLQQFTVAQYELLMVKLQVNR